MITLEKTKTEHKKLENQNLPEKNINDEECGNWLIWKLPDEQIVNDLEMWLNGGEEWVDRLIFDLLMKR